MLKHHIKPSICYKAYLRILTRIITSVLPKTIYWLKYDVIFYQTWMIYLLSFQPSTNSTLHRKKFLEGQLGNFLSNFLSGSAVHKRCRLKIGNLWPPSIPLVIFLVLHTHVNKLGLYWWQKTVPYTGINKLLGKLGKFQLI